jgi:serine/threonine protein kinase
VTIQKLRHHEITTSERLPYIGRHEPIKSGSQGQVFKAEIAPCHWEIRENEDQENSDFVPGNPNSTKVVALKVFKAAEPARNMLEATLDFDIELIILRELRTYQTMHKMIMLHLGSITELDGAGHSIKHSLIFELASFSLGDLLSISNRAQKDIMPSGLLISLVDIVEALECLHDKLETLHLDIKPDNILIFENHSGSDKQYELVWKLSDFGLARKKEAKQRAASKQNSTATSRASTLPATRPAGLYQAPEIQKQETSQAGRGSDVWSMGCVTLMVLAFIYGGPVEVNDLERSLMVKFMDLGGREPLFYIRSDSYSWQHRTSHICHYLQNQDLDVGLIPRTAGPLRAALHPGLIDWSNILVEDSYAFRKEQKFVIYILRVIVGSVLLIDRSKRMGASDLRGKLAYIQREWEKYDLAPDNYVHPDALAELSFTRSRRSRGFETSPSGQSDESSPVRVPQVPTVLPTAITDSRATFRDLVEVTLHPIPSIEYSVPDVPSQVHEPVQAQTGTPASLVEREAPEDQRGLTPELNPRIQEELCSAIEQNDATSVRFQLDQYPEMLGQLLPGAKRYSIHWALFNNAYQALDVLLEKASLEITNLPYNGRTALDLALDSGRPAALECIREHRDKFEFPLPLYEKRKKKLGREAKAIAKDLFAIKKAATPRERSILGFRRNRTANAST